MGMLIDGRGASVLLGCICLLGCATTGVSVVPTTSNTTDEKFTALMAEHWSHFLKTNPTFATSLGVRDYDDQLADPSLAGYDRHIDRMRDFLLRLEQLNSAQLSDQQALNHQLLKLDLENEIEAANHGGRFMLITNRSGPHLTITRLPTSLPFFTIADYQSYIVRLGEVPLFMDRSTGRLKAGVDQGWLQPCAPMMGYEESIDTHLVADVEDSVLMDPFNERPRTISVDQFAALKRRATEVIQADVLPAFARFAEFYRSEYAPNCRTAVGTSEMPGGREYYEFRARLFTTTDLDPEQIHQIGLDEVTRIKAEMAEVIEQAEFAGTFQDWLKHLRDSPQFYPKTAEERMQVAAAISKRMDGLLPQLFTRFPRMPYGLKEIPADIAEKTTTAYYSSPAGDGSRAGFYYVNTTKLNTRPLYELEALSLHEAVPGHHFQIALAQELDLPPFRRFGGQTAFVEGWGLYSERLGLEAGFYKTPYTNFGRLSYEMWRACRLVVDTGMHAKGWSRQQAIDFMVENSALSMNNITTEVDRYITWPGQALAYKIGELKIRELRASAEAALSERFDVRLFHDAVLENGALPLSVLEDKIETWIQSQ